MNPGVRQPILGILSDSHARHERTARALALLKSRGATAFAHCGDIGADEVLDALAAAAQAHPVMPVWFVWGNTDDVTPAITRYAQAIGLTPPSRVPVSFELAGKRFGLFHGHEAAFDRVDPADFDYILHGHTHERRDERIGDVRIVNPGALQRAREYSVALLDPATDRLEFLRVD